MSTPPENGGFIFRKNPNQISCEQEVPDYPASNLFSNNPNIIFMNDGHSTKIEMIYDTPTTLTAISIINHSIPSNAIIRLQYFEGEFETWIGSIEIPWSKKSIYYKFSSITYKSYRLYITEISGTVIYIGEFVPGYYFQFPYNYEWGFEESFNVVKEVVTSDEGVHFEVPSSDAPEYSKFKVKFSNSPANNLSLFYDIIRIGKKVFIPDFTQPECYFGIVPDSAINAIRTIKGDEYSISFWQDAISGDWIE